MNCYNCIYFKADQTGPQIGYCREYKLKVENRYSGCSLGERVSSIEITWLDLKAVLPEDLPIITDTDYGCYENLNKDWVPGKFDNYFVTRILPTVSGFYVKLT